MKAQRFHSLTTLLGTLAAVLTLAASSAMAQMTLPAPTADNTFGRLSWYTNVTNFGSNTAFGVFGQANRVKGFGVFGNGGINGTYGGGFWSVINGTGRNIGAWALGANATSGTGTFLGRLNIGLEVGANDLASSGLYGWAIRVDSGDVELGGTGGPQNTTYVHNLVIDGSVSGLNGANQFNQATTGGTVTTTASTLAPVVAVTGATNTDNGIAVVDTGSGASYYANSINSGALMVLQKNGTTVDSIYNNGNVSIGPGKFTVAAASGNTENYGTLEQHGVVFSGETNHTVRVADSLSVSGNMTVGGGTFVAEKTGQTTITDATTTGAASFNVTNNVGTTGYAMNVKGGNTTGFASTLTELTGANQGTNFLALVVSGGVPTAGGAAVGITHGAYIDSLRDDKYVDFTGATIKGISGLNQFNQYVTTGPVTTSASTLAPVVGVTSSGNTDAVIVAIDSGSGTAFQAKAAGTGALMELQTGGGTDLVTVGNNGDLTVGQAASGTFNVLEGSGKTTITDKTTTGAASFNVTNSAGTTGAAVDVTASNTTGFTSTLTDNGGTNFLALTTVSTADVPATGGAAVGITHGAYIDSLRDDKYVDFTGATIIGISGLNDYTQTTAGSPVTTSAATTAALVANITDAANTDPDLLLNNASTGGVVIQANQTAGATLMQLQNAGANVFKVAGTGNLTIGANVNAVPKFTVLAASGKTSISDSSLTGASSFNVTNGAGTTGTAMTISGGNTTGFSSTLTEPSGAAGLGTDFLAMTFAGLNSSVLTAGGASVGITHGAFIDSLRDNQYVDFTGATVIGVSGLNHYTQNGTGQPVTTSSDVNAVLVAEVRNAANTDPAINVVDSGSASTMIKGNSINGGDMMHLQANGTDKVVVTGGGNTTVTTTSGNSVTAVSTSAATTDYALKASGNGATGANALNINNGGVVVSGGAQPAGVASVTIGAGYRTDSVTISNALAQTTSYIIVTATGIDNGDTYSATVTNESAGTFNVKVTDVEGNLLNAAGVQINYWIVNH